MSTISNDEVIDFVYDEARLLDEQRYEEWLSLFTPDGRYWMPLTPDQTDPVLQGSLMYEDELLLKVRIERLAGQRTFSQQPRSRSHHLLQRPSIETGDAWHQPDNHQFVVRAAFHYLETRLDQQTLYAGWATYRLCVLDDSLRMQQKRIDLVNCESAFRSIQLFM